MTRLIAVTLLLAVLAIVLKVRTRGTTTGRAIKVTSRMAVGRNAMIAVVEVEGQRLLIGTGGSQVTLLGVLNNPGQPNDASQSRALAAVENVTSHESLEHAIAQPINLRAIEVPVAPRPSSLLDRARRMTARTADVQLRVPKRTAARR